MHLLLWLFALLGVWAVGRMTPGQALITVYLPVLLVFPDTFHAITPGLPDPSANVALMIPIFLACMSAYGRYWRPSVTDWMVIGFTALLGVSEYQAAGYSEAQNLLFGTVFQVVAPYLVARLAVARENLHVALAKRMVILMFGVGMVGLFESRFGWNPFLTFGERLFAGQGLGWVTTFRHGFARVAGPYAHCILAGMMMVMAYRINRWLEWGGHWEPRFRWQAGLPWSKARVITLGLLLASLTTIARGPWIGGVIGALLVRAGRAPKPRLAFSLLFGGLLLAAPPAYIVFNSYLDVQPGAEMTLSQETAMYRKVLFEKYYDIAWDHAWLGWGRNTWPKVAGMGSIDNYYLLLSLMHGVLATGILIALMLWMSVRLFITGIREPAGGNSLAFTFLGIIVAFAVSIVTVYMGEAVVPAFFLMLGWAEAYVQGGMPDTVKAAPQQDIVARRSRVMQ